MAKLTKADLRRRTIDDTLEYLSDGDYNLDDLLAKHGTGLTLRFELGYYDDPDSVSIHRIREETDEEYEARLEQIRAYQKAEEARKRNARREREEAERKTYERLRRKFEKE